jgi:hypothetical protein
MKSLESIYNSILLENQNPNNIDLKLLKGCIIGKYTINDDGSIDVDGMVRLTNKYLTKIPFKFRNVSGSFWCNSNQLSSLKGAPNSVGGGFYCYNNQLTSLEGAPNSVGGVFNCSNNPNLPYSELFKIVDRVRDDIYYSSHRTLEDKDKIRRDRDIKNVLKDDELGSLDV